MDQKTRKFMTIRKALRSRIQSICVKKKKNTPHHCGLCVDTSTQGIEEYIKKTEERLIISIHNSISNLIRQQK